MGGEVRLCDKPVAWRIRLVEEAPCGPLLVRDGRLIVPMALFTGPPGTGKTHAMRILARSANLKAYVFDAVGLQEVSWEPRQGLSFRGLRGYRIFAAVYALRWKYPRS